MNLNKPLYLSPTIKNANKLLRKLKSSNKLCSFYVLTIANNNDQLDIYPAYCLQQPFYKSFSLTIIGLASNREEAFDLVLKITNDSFTKTGDYDLKKYLLTR